MQATWEEIFKVRAYDVDFKDRLKVSSIFNYMQDIASAHAVNLHCGFEDLQRLDLFWVLSWIKVEFNSFPHFEDKIKIKTWAKGRYKLFALRDFLLYDEQDNIFCRAASAWLMLNSKSKRITDIKNLQILFPYQSDMHALEDMPEKIKYENKRESIYERSVSYTDIDLNLHVNNAKYVEYLMNCYPLEFHDGNSLKSITMSFNSEMKYEEVIEICVNKTPGDLNLHYVEGVNKSTVKQAFQALIKWNNKI